MTNFFLVLTLCQLLLIPGQANIEDFWGVGLTGVFRGRRHRAISEEYNSISEGGRLALKECQKQFFWERWNCPSSVFIRWGKKTHEPLTREVAFLDALISSGIAYAVNRNCSINSICKMPKKHKDNAGDQLEWGECAVDKFLINSKGRLDIQAYANAHNSNVGKQIIRSTSSKECKCHGTSGTCTIKSCWIRMAPFSVIADKIREEYERAILLDYEGGIGSMKLGNSAAAGTTLGDSKLSELPTNRLVYLQRSPDFCKKHSASGWPGTYGRLCWRSDPERVTSPKKNCRKLCRKCGYKVRKARGRTTSLCRCRITGCCTVVCDKCNITVKEHYCY